MKNFIPLILLLMSSSSFAAGAYFERPYKCEGKHLKGTIRLVDCSTVTESTFSCGVNLQLTVKSNNTVAYNGQAGKVDLTDYSVNVAEVNPTWTAGNFDFVARPFVEGRGGLYRKADFAVILASGINDHLSCR